MALLGHSQARYFLLISNLDLGEALHAHDGVDDKRVASWSGNVGGMVPQIEGDRRFRPAKEGGDDRLGGTCLSVAYLVLALGADGVESPEDHDAFLGVGEAIPVLSRRASFLGCRLFVVSFFQPAGMSQEMFEELAVLVEVFDGVGVVGAWAIHELVEVVRLALLGLLAHAISCGDQRGVGQSAPIL